MEPQIGIRGRGWDDADSLRDADGFNGAPDRNPGKESTRYQRRTGLRVSMEPQIGIRGRKCGGV